MPTGYTNAVLEGATFEEFVWGCARAFGALAPMREDLANKPVPDKFEPSTYHAIELKEAEERLETIQALDSSAWEKRYNEYLKKLHKEDEGRKQRDDDTRFKYTQMLHKVRAWEPPTAGHCGLKNFMIEQLEQSIDFDIIGDRFKPAILGFDEWKRVELDRALKDINYHKGEFEKERQRVASRNNWISALRESVPQPTKL